MARLTLTPFLTMILIEPNLPSMPVNVTGSMQTTPQNEARRMIGKTWGYGPARLALKVAFGLECGLAVGVVVYCGLMRSGVTALLAAVGCVGVLVVSFAAMEMAGAVFDIADGQVGPEGRDERPPGAGKARW